MLLFFIGWLALMLIGVPISYSLFISTSAYLLFYRGCAHRHSSAHAVGA